MPASADLLVQALPDQLRGAVIDDSLDLRPEVFLGEHGPKLRLYELPLLVKLWRIQAKNKDALADIDSRTRLVVRAQIPRAS